MGDRSLAYVCLGGETLTWTGKYEYTIPKPGKHKVSRAGGERNGPPFISPKSGMVVELNDFAIDWTPGYATDAVLSLYVVGAAKPIWTQTGVESKWGHVDAADARAAIKRQMGGRKGQVFVLVLSDGRQDTLAAWFTVR